MKNRQEQSRNLSRMQGLVKYTTEDDKVDEIVKLSEEEIVKKREEEITGLQNMVAKYQTAKDEINKEMQAMVASIHQFDAMINEQSLETERLEKEYRILKKMMDLLPNAQENILELQKISAQSANKLIELAKEWEKHRGPLLDQIRSLRGQIAGSKDETKIKLEKIQEMRAQMKSFAEEVHGKDERYNELLEAFNKAPKDLTRTYYTTRILDIVKNVKKQKVDISKILLDTRNSQKEINSITDTLNRVFAIVDEMIFQDAKKDTNAKEVYKLNANINENFKKLTAKVEEIGKSRNEILNLDSKIEQLQERTSSLNMERIEEDLKEIKTENKGIMAQLAGGAK